MIVRIFYVSINLPEQRYGSEYYMSSFHDQIFRVLRNINDHLWKSKKLIFRIVRQRYTWDEIINQQLTIILGFSITKFEWKSLAHLNSTFWKLNAWSHDIDFPQFSLPTSLLRRSVKSPIVSNNIEADL